LHPTSIRPRCLQQLKNTTASKTRNPLLFTDLAFDFPFLQDIVGAA